MKNSRSPSIWQCLPALFILFAAIGCSDRPDTAVTPGEVSAIASSVTGDVDRTRLMKGSSEPGNWLMGGRDYQQSYFSPLTAIDKNNVSDLGFAWELQLETVHGFEATPIVIDGVMFSSGPLGAVYALDAKTGRKRWFFEPEVDPDVMRKLCCGVVNRGVAVWKGRVFVASLDGFLYALDAESGEVLWKTNTIADSSRAYSVTGAPYVANDMIVIGNGGAELDARGYVTAYHHDTGEQAWRFYTVPGDPKLGFEHPELEAAAATWDPNSLWEVGLGGTAWDGMAWDPELNLLYVGTGNSAPWVQKFRSPAGGDNLFLASILAINPESGRLVWHYQLNPGESWDYTATQKLILADLEIEGKMRQVVMQAPKNGFFYVLDRKTGEVISAEPYVPVNWASHIDLQTGRPAYTGQEYYFESPKLLFPGSAGAHNWQPMSYSPLSGLVYIPAYVLPMIYKVSSPEFSYQPGGANMGTTVIFPVPGSWGLDGEMAKGLPPLTELGLGQPEVKLEGYLKAWDPVKQKLVWEVETSGDWAGHFFTSWNGGGLMSTAGDLLFQGRSTGYLHVLDSMTGEELHSINVGTSIMAAPMTYTVEGEQYVAVMAGLGGAMGNVHLPGTAAYKYGNKGRIVAFKLGGGEVPLPAELDHDETMTPPSVMRRGTDKQQAAGVLLYQRHCAICHTGAGGNIPDLSKMKLETHESFLDIVLRGVRADKGMGSFESILSEEEAESIHSYLIERAWKNFEANDKTKASHTFD